MALPWLRREFDSPYPHSILLFVFSSRNGTVSMCMIQTKNEMLQDAAEKGEFVAKEFNPETYIPFPFEKIVKGHDNLDLRFGDLSNIDGSSDNEKDLSGLILYDQDEEKFTILIEKRKHENRKYFTIAHEFGHYFLHNEVLKEKDFVVDGETILYRLDNGLSNMQESQANYFAASLLMPKDRVTEAWYLLKKDIERCAELFSVSLSAMSVRIDILGLKHD